MLSKLTLDDTYRVTTISHPRISPDGDLIAYIDSRPIKGADTHSQNLVVVPTIGGEPYPMTRYQAHDDKPQWSPDGRYLAFLSERATELELVSGQDDQQSSLAKARSQIWVFDRIFGGEPRQLTRREEGVVDFNWAPDSRQVVFSGRDPSEEEATYLKSIRDEKSPGPLVINRTQHKHDGDGYLDTVKTHLFIANVITRTITRLTDGPANEESPVWSPDGQWILFLSNRTGDADNNRRKDLWLINPLGTESKRLTQGDVAAYGHAFSPDSQKVAFVTSESPESGYVLDRLYIVRVEDATPTPSLSQAIGQGWSTVGGIVPDVFAKDPIEHAHVYPIPIASTPMHLISETFEGNVSGSIHWVDNHHLWALAHHFAQQKIIQFSTAATPHEIIFPTERIGTVVDYDANTNGVAIIYNRPEHGRELYTRTQGEFQQITHSGAWLEERSLGTHHWIQYHNHDGDVIEAVVLTPPNFSPGQGPIPLLVTIHGGPMWYDTIQFDFDSQYWATQGYLVLMVNYRGSISYGESFCQSIQGDWGPREHDDVMSGIDYLLAREWTREDQLFCTGFSQGGIMTNWAVGHTNRFRAAITEHGMWDYLSAFGTDDCHLWWQDDLGVPWQNPEAYYRISPMSGLQNIRTPLLITAGEHDWRCPLNQAEELYMALKKRGVPTELIIYPGEHHGITRPTRAIDRLHRMNHWLAQWGGLPITDSK